MNPWQNYFIRLLFCFYILDIFASENDWTNWLGPNHNGYVEGNLNLSSKPNLNDTNVLWQNAVGTGWSSPIVSGNKVFLHDRIGNKENMTAYSLSTGKRDLAGFF